MSAHAGFSRAASTAMLTATLTLVLYGLAAAEPSFPAIEAEPLGTVSENAVVLHAGWQMRESALAGNDGASFSRPALMRPAGTRPRSPPLRWARSCVTGFIPIPMSA